jgi:hypothetical protein
VVLESVQVFWGIYALSTLIPLFFCGVYALSTLIPLFFCGIYALSALIPLFFATILNSSRPVFAVWLAITI